MIHFALHDENGRIVRSGAAPDEAMARLNEKPGLTLVLDVPAETTPGTHFFVPGEQLPQAIPARPSAAAVWNHSARQWEDDLAKAVQLRREEIRTERDRRARDAVVVYGGIRLDADAEAIENVKVKLIELEARVAKGDPMPANKLVWRDADDQMHVWPDQASYLDWLRGFAILLGSRGTDAYAWSWEKKAQLEACTTAEQVLALSLD